MNGVQKAVRERKVLRAKAKEDLRKRVHKLKAEGLSVSALVHRLGVSSSLVYSLLKER